MHALCARKLESFHRAFDGQSASHTSSFSLFYIHCRVTDSKSLYCEKLPSKDKKQHKVTLNEVYSAN